VDDELTFRRHRHIYQQVLKHTELTEQRRAYRNDISVLAGLRSRTNIGLSQQIEIQHDNSSKVTYVQGGWLRSFVFKVTTARSSSRTTSPA